MRLPAHLRLSRHNIYYFRIVIPAHLRPLFHGRRELLQSLGTRDPKLAKMWAYSLSARVSDTFEKATAAMTNGYDPTKLDLNDPSSWPVGDADVRHLEIEIPGVGTIKSDPTIPGDDENAIKAAERLFANPVVQAQMDKQHAHAESENARLKQVVAEHSPEHEKCRQAV